MWFGKLCEVGIFPFVFKVYHQCYGLGLKQWVAIEFHILHKQVTCKLAFPNYIDMFSYRWLWMYGVLHSRVTWSLFHEDALVLLTWCAILIIWIIDIHWVCVLFAWWHGYISLGSCLDDVTWMIYVHVWWHVEALPF